MVFQNYALFPHLIGAENVAFGLQMRGIARGRDHAAGSTRRSRLVQLEEHADKLPGQLSGGQQQRVAIARAVVLRAAAGADGRAAVQPGRQAAPGDAHRDPAAAPVARA